MFIAFRHRFCTWMYAKSVALTNWSRLQLIKVNAAHTRKAQMHAVPGQPLEVLYDGCPVEHGFVKRADLIQQTHTLQEAWEELDAS